MSTTRTNKGKPTGEFLAEIGIWNLSKTGEGRYKLYARDPVNGKANYAFGVKNGAPDPHAALDFFKLREERPELLKSLEAYLAEEMSPIVIAAAAKEEEEQDPYGDLALQRRRKLTPEQEWKRALLHMRRVALEAAAAKKDTIWESGVRMSYAAIFGQKISDADVVKAIHWITQRQAEIDLKSLLQILTDYYAGKFGPRKCVVLAEQLDLLANNMTEFNNEEEANNGVGNVELDGKRPDQTPTAEGGDRGAEPEAGEGARGTAVIDRGAGGTGADNPTTDSAAVQHDGSEQSSPAGDGGSSEGQGNGEELFSAFQ
jgi:hypothetical protein